MKERILLISDVDGCLTDGGMYYSSDGKEMKRFSAGDHEGLKLLKKNDIEVLFITADKVGFPITKMRMRDMSNSEVHVISENDRLDFIEQCKNAYDKVIFFGDGLGDIQVKLNKACDLFICPKQARKEVKMFSDYVCEYEGGHGAFLDMAIWVCENHIPNHKKLY